MFIFTAKGIATASVSLPQDIGRREKTPTPQDKIQHLDFTKDPPAALLQDPSLCILPQKCP